jgi:type I restriction enzyme S subunit
LNIEDFLKIPIVIPPLPEQQRIADYLDKKCGEIDELIALQEQMIAQLTDYKQSVITEAVTKGLNPDVQLIPSGIDWIGDVPEGWKVCRIKDLFVLRTGTTPKDFEQGLDSDALVNWFTPSDVSEMNCVLVSSERHLSEIVVKKEGIELNPIGSLIFVGIGASAGKIGYANVMGYSNQQITTLIPRKNKCFSKYSYYYMIADRKRIRDNAFFTTLPIINNSYLSCVKTLLPPMEEQRTIAIFLDTKCSEIDSLISLKQQKIETLKDYKKSVIYEAVTGKTFIGSARADLQSDRCEYKDF